MTLGIRFVGALLLAFAAGAQAQNLSIATGGTGGVYYPMGGGLGAVLSKAIPGVNATAEVTGGSVANLPDASSIHSFEPALFSSFI
jgi:TRAP-type uncharacterized transport system substrate-binding protein